MLKDRYIDIYEYSSLAQSVEHMTVNHRVVGSSPTGGAIYGPLVKWPKTPPSHGGNTSSNLVRVTISVLSELYMFAITVNLDSDF